MNFEEFKQEFISWIIKNIEPICSETGFSVCPYAKRARLQEKIQFIHAERGIYGEFLEFDSDKYDIGVVWLGDFVDGIESEIEELRRDFPDLLYYISTPNSGFFTKNFTNCVFIQKREEILQKRENLKKTKYYDNWPKWYYNEIVNGQ